MTGLTLLTLPPSPHNTKVRLALKLKALDFETVLVGFEDRSAVVERSGQPLTPVLIDGERVVYDSFGIMRYLDANWPEPRLFSEEREKQREIEAWERFAVAELGGALGLVAGQLFSGKIDDEATRQAQKLLDALPERVEDALADSDYLMGARPNAADLTVMPFLIYAATSPTEYPEGTPMRFVAERLELSARFTLTRAWIERVRAIDLAPAA
ncbi:MAG: glutathione S-transferase family protein [Planctomycetes bacterium]|nr:glutathione S-transferase family protein [Planctomycetota bacterium]